VERRRKKENQIMTQRLKQQKADQEGRDKEVPKKHSIWIE
jgi:hypothetical protein